MKAKILLFTLIFSCLLFSNLWADCDRSFCYEYGYGLKPYCDDGYTCYRPVPNQKVVVVIVPKSSATSVQRYCENISGFAGHGINFSRENLPYGYMDDTNDDEIRSPWSNVEIPTSGHVAGQVLFDPNTAKPFRVPPYGDDYLE